MELTLEDYEKLQPRMELEHEGVRMAFATPNTFTAWRARGIYEKEPWTLEWVASFQPGATFLDCGANVGMYTIWAAATRLCRVYAFEPESQNYALLNRNIVLNDLAERVTAFCVGLSDASGLSVLHIADLRPGASCHALGAALDFKNEPLQSVFTQGCVSATLDGLVAAGTMPVPNHIKIDVDGIEPKVIAGARQTLANPQVESLLIETNANLQEHVSMVAEMNDLGFRYDATQVARAQRKDGAFKGVAEYIFRR